MQYVAVLGCILIIFVCTGYCVLQKTHRKFEKLLLGGIVILLGTIALVLCIGKS